MIQGELRSNLGYLFETLCVEMLIASSFKPFYTIFEDKNGKGNMARYEIDFLFAYYDKVQPLECKANAVHKPASLIAFGKKY